MPPPVIGVATSVGWDGRTYDTFAALAYAQAHAFPLVQVYLTPELLANPAARQRVIAAAGGIRLMCHAPAVLGDSPATAPAVTAAARDLLRNEADRWVVHHFDESQPVEESVTWAERLRADGVVPCIENFHVSPGPDAARRHYANYLKLFRRLRGVPAVIDVPRFFDAKLELTHDEATDLAVHVLHELAGLGVPVIFHLIDSATRDVTERHRWCPVGEGIIGYVSLLPRILAKELIVPAVVLEFDDREDPVPSRVFLETWWSQSAR